MSVIAVKKYNDRIEIAADSIEVRGNLIDKFPKLIKNNMHDFYVGVTGDSNYCDFLMNEVKNLTPKSNSFGGMSLYIKNVVDKIKQFFDVDTKSVYDNLFAIFVYNERIWVLLYGGIKEITDYYAIGAAQTEVTTLLHIGKSPKESVEIACELNTDICLPVTYFTIKK